jgi:hypothetical protein
MKSLILTFVLAIGTNAFAAVNQFEPAFNLSFFSIGAQSTLPETEAILNGQIMMNSATNQVQLNLHLGDNCKTTICPRFVLAPYQLTLPVVAQSQDACGVATIVAEQDLRSQGGEYMKLEILDHRGDTCMKNAMTIRTVSLTLTEQAANSNEPIVSTMAGLPAQN